MTAVDIISYRGLRANKAGFEKTIAIDARGNAK